MNTSDIETAISLYKGLSVFLIIVIVLTFAMVLFINGKVKDIRQTVDIILMKIAEHENKTNVIRSEINKKLDTISENKGPA